MKSLSTVLELAAGLCLLCATAISQELTDVRFWAYQIQKQHFDGAIEALADSHYDLLVVDNIRSLIGDEDYPNADDIATLKSSLNSVGKPKIVVCYIDIGEAEEYRYYWKEGWGVGNPEWIVAPDPDGWEENYPVKYWRQDWRDIVFGNQDAMIDRIIADGYDGIYLDWVEAYDFSLIDSCAAEEGLDAREEMIEFVIDMTEYSRSKKPGFLVIPQNAVAIAGPEDMLTARYLSAIDAIAQEDIWFDGEADEHGQQGDWPMDPQLTAEYIAGLVPFQQAGLPVFTVDYAEKPENVDSCYRAASRLGYIEYVSLRQLDRLTSTPPPGYLTSVDERTPIPVSPTLQVFPNPTPGGIAVVITVTRQEKLLLRLCDLLGRNVNTIAEQVFIAGQHHLQLDLHNLPPGQYYLSVSSKHSRIVKGLTILHWN